MKLVYVLLLLIPCTLAWDYLMFVQLWPGSWIERTDSDLGNFTNDYFTVHGIWPQDDDGSWPQYCNSSHLFDPYSVKPLWPSLVKYWTNFKNPLEFWEHEWNKHGRCAMTDHILENEYQFFDYGLTLRNTTDLFQVFTQHYVSPSNIKKYNTQYILTFLKLVFGNDISVICNPDSVLNEIRICYDKNFDQIDCPYNMMQENCKSPYIIMNKV